MKSYSTQEGRKGQEWNEELGGEIGIRVRRGRRGSNRANNSLTNANIPQVLRHVGPKEGPFVLLGVSVPLKRNRFLSLKMDWFPGGNRV